MNDYTDTVEVRDEQGRLTGRFEMADGRLHGRATLYGPVRVLAEIQYSHGLRQGEMRSYGESEELSSIVPHAADLPHGEARYFYPDGKLARSAHYRNGLLHGEVCDYAPDGELLSTSHYVDGKRQDGAGQRSAASAENKPTEPRKSWLARLVEG
jgi:antitoxin component YwqK of YwqJK toxin-antitoxin module